MDDTFRVTINGIAPFDGKEYYKPGQIVKLRCPLATDSRTSISAEGIDGLVERENSCLTYTFIMPERDVDVNLEYVNIMVYNPDVSPVGFGMGMGNGMTDFNQSGLENPIVANKKSTMNFCPECGALKDADKEYCTACCSRLGI